MVTHWGGGVRQQYPLLSVSPSDSCFALLFVFPQVNAVFLDVSSSSSEYAEIVVRIENVIRIMAPLFCVFFFSFGGGKFSAAASLLELSEKILLPCISQIITKLGFARRI